jgi:hypothetical protein
MAIHVYMSTQRGERQPDGTLTVPDDAEMAYRGEMGPGDDPQGFVRRQNALGYVVVLTDHRCKGEVKSRKRPGAPQQGPRCAYGRLAALEG